MIDEYCKYAAAAAAAAAATAATAAAPAADASPPAHANCLTYPLATPTIDTLSKLIVDVEVHQVRTGGKLRTERRARWAARSGGSGPGSGSNGLWRKQSDAKTDSDFRMKTFTDRIATAATLARIIAPVANLVVDDIARCEAEISDAGLN